MELIRGGVAHGVEPAAAPGGVAPPFGELAFRVGPEEYVMGPLLVAQCERVVGIGDMRLPAIVKFGLFPGSAPRAFDELHGCSSRLKCRATQCATAAAPCSSTSAPVTKRSRLNGATYGCGSSRAMVSARHQPMPGVALNPPVPQPQLRYRLR